MKICHKQKIKNNNLKANFHSSRNMCLDPISGFIAATTTVVTILQAPMVYEFYKNRFVSNKKGTNQLKCLARDKFTNKLCKAPAEYVQVEIDKGIQIKALRCMRHKHHLITYGTHKMIKQVSDQ